MQSNLIWNCKSNFFVDSDKKRSKINLSYLQNRTYAKQKKPWSCLERTNY